MTDEQAEKLLELVGEALHARGAATIAAARANTEAERAEAHRLDRERDRTWGAVVRFVLALRDGRTP